jgi:hypothetical protein
MCPKGVRCAPWLGESWRTRLPARVPAVARPGDAHCSVTVASQVAQSVDPGAFFHDLARRCDGNDGVRGWKLDDQPWQRRDASGILHDHRHRDRCVRLNDANPQYEVDVSSAVSFAGEFYPLPVK